MGQDTTTGKFNVAQLGKTTKAGFRTYFECCTDYRVFLMIFQYSACFGCELVMNNTLATHFHDYFGVDLVAAGVLATAFGGMGLLAASRQTGRIRAGPCQDACGHTSSRSSAKRSSSSSSAASPRTWVGPSLS